MGIVSELERLVSADEGAGIAWDRVEELLEPSGFTRMRGLPQNPAFHGERDVMTHTRMVCEWLLGSDGFRGSSHGRRVALLGMPLLGWFAAVLHLAGCTGDMAYVRIIAREPMATHVEDTERGISLLHDE